MANKKPLTKTTLIANLVEETGLTKQQVGLVLDGLTTQISKALEKSGPGEITALPGLLKIEVKDKPARPAQRNVPNPFKPGETMDVAAKPASKAIKIRALKGLREMV